MFCGEKRTRNSTQKVLCNAVCSVSFKKKKKVSFLFGAVTKQCIKTLIVQLKKKEKKALLGP